MQKCIKNMQNMFTPLSFQSGKSSLRAVGSMQAPDNVCRPELEAQNSYKYITTSSRFMLFIL